MWRLAEYILNLEGERLECRLFCKIGEYGFFPNFKEFRVRPAGCLDQRLIERQRLAEAFLSCRVALVLIA